MTDRAAAHPGILAALGLTVKRLVCMASESVFLIAGIIIGYSALPEMAKAMEQNDFDPGPLAHLAIEWYWVLLAMLGVHIVLWMIVPRLFGWAGLIVWYVLGVALPLLVLATPAFFVFGAYASVLTQS